ncbi:MAG: hypothetical protein AB8F34_12270 [Akkermansiaceae bacterium]
MDDFHGGLVGAPDSCAIVTLVSADSAVGEDSGGVIDGRTTPVADRYVAGKRATTDADLGSGITAEPAASPISAVPGDSGVGDHQVSMVQDASAMVGTISAGEGQAVEADVLIAGDFEHAVISSGLDGETARESGGVDGERLVNQELAIGESELGICVKDAGFEGDDVTGYGVINSVT